MKGNIDYLCLVMSILLVHLEIGSAESVGVKAGGIMAFDQDTIRPVSNLIRDEFSGSKQLEFRFRSDSSRFFSPKDTKLKVEYELAFCKTAGSFADNTEHDMCRFTACPGMALFDGGLKYMCNNTLVENQTEPYTASMATLLMKTDVPSSDTSASGSLMTLRKDVKKSLAAPTTASGTISGSVPAGTLTRRVNVFTQGTGALAAIPCKVGVCKTCTHAAVAAASSAQALFLARCFFLRDFLRFSRCPRALDGCPALPLGNTPAPSSSDTRSISDASGMSSF
jgi:hypothetical protein